MSNYYRLYLIEEILFYQVEPFYTRQELKGKNIEKLKAIRENKGLQACIKK